MRRRGGLDKTISKNEYLEFLITHKECQACGATDELCVDHCHITGQIRGVLCKKCNRGIGLLGDTIESVAKVYNYLNVFYLKNKANDPQV